MPDVPLDLLVYHDMTDPIHDALPSVGQDAEKWFGDSFAGLYVVAVGPPIHEGRAATVVLAHESRPEMMQDIKAYVDRAAPTA